MKTPGCANGWYSSKTTTLPVGASPNSERATRDRNTAMRAARDNGHTWRAIAEAAGMTQHGVRLALRNAELRAAAGE